MLNIRVCNYLMDWEQTKEKPFKCNKMIFDTDICKVNIPSMIDDDDVKWKEILVNIVWKLFCKNYLLNSILPVHIVSNIYLYIINNGMNYLQKINWKYQIYTSKNSCFFHLKFSPINPEKLNYRQVALLCRIWTVDDKQIREKLWLNW